MIFTFLLKQTPHLLSFALLPKIFSFLSTKYQFWDIKCSLLREDKAVLSLIQFPHFFPILANCWSIIIAKPSGAPLGEGLSPKTSSCLETLFLIFFFFSLSWKILSIRIPARDPSLDQVFVLSCNGLSQSHSDTRLSFWVSAWSSTFTEARVYSIYWEIEPLCVSFQMKQSSYFWLRSGVCLLGAFTLWGVAAGSSTVLGCRASVPFITGTLWSGAHKIPKPKT